MFFYNEQYPLENAFQFAKSEVNVEISWDSDQIIIVIKDDGPGFLPAVLSRLGEPYISGFQGNQGLGLGIFIAKTLLERTGAGLEFFNQHPNGGSVKVSWSTGFLKTLSAEGM